MKSESYERVFKFCEVCRKTGQHILESTVTVCENCGERNDSDADDLFGIIDEAVE